MKLKNAAALFLAVIFTVSLGSAALNVPAGQGLTVENLDVGIEMLPDARCHVTATFEASAEEIDLSNFPVSGANLNLNISRSGVEKITAELRGAIHVTEDAFNTLPQELLKLTAENLNILISVSGIEGRPLSELLGSLGNLGKTPAGEIPEEIGNVVLEDLSVTRFFWQGTTLNFGITCTVHGAALANENLEKMLPASLEASLNVSGASISVTMNAEAGSSRLNANITATRSGGLTLIRAGLEAYFKLPVREDRVEWSPLLPAIGGLAESLQENAQNMNLAVTVPENAEVGELPPGYEQSGYTYTWSGPDAAEAFRAFLGGGPVNVTYEYVPPPPDLLPWIIGGAVAAVVVASIWATIVRRRKR